jgi:hypothetical protein
VLRKRGREQGGGRERQTHTQIVAKTAREKEKKKEGERQSLPGRECFK